MARITEREQLIFDIATAEWDFFQLVENTGGRASCQDDPDTFFKMRMSQWMAYSDEVLKSYWTDLERAAEEGRNPIFEKYGRMMETAYPEEYARMKGQLPQVSKEKAEQVERIVKIHLKWDRQMMEQYPNIRKNGRVMITRDDSAYEGISMESYLRCELMTFSDQTVELIFRETMKAFDQGENLLKAIIQNETAFYGYADLEEAEAAHAGKEA